MPVKGRRQHQDASSQDGDPSSDKHRDESSEDGDPSSDKDKDKDNVSEYQVMRGYDSGFLSYSSVTNITKMLNDDSKDEFDDLVSSFTDSDRETVTLPFLFGVLLKISPPADHKNEGNQVTQFRTDKSHKRQKIVTGGYKKQLLFGDLRDPKCQTFSILEPTNDTHNMLFQNKSMENVTVGALVAITSPTSGGTLPSGALIIKTDRPLVFLTAPEIPERPLHQEKAQEDLLFFVLKNKTVQIRKSSSVTPIETACNGKACDRLQAAKNPKAVCGCWSQSSRSDTTAKNTVLKFTFYFRDSDDRILEVEDFTSLKWSKLLFSKGQILAERDELLKHNVFQELQVTFRRIITHVNNNGGWTIVGWFKRAEVKDEDKELTEDNVLRENIKINVSHLYPTALAEIPTDLQLKHTHILDLLSPPIL